mmetsp:Transcript_29312/g.64903  ORF Transcript_29312/g.64903 Transcript_29312/m.64903 type:complete len:145 (+) Transcript_29312:2787-3221(+)
MMFSQFFEVVQGTLGMNGTQPDLRSAIFKYAWNAQHHVGGGMDRLNTAYTSHVLSVYSDVLTLHILALVFTLLIMAAYLLLLMRPYVRQATAETRRIAELLSQLPTDVDVEGLVKRALINTGSVPTGSKKGELVSLKSFSKDMA